MDTKNTMDWKLVLNYRTRLVGDESSQTAVLSIEADVMRSGQPSVEDIVSALRVVNPEIIIHALEKALLMAAETFVKTHNETCDDGDSCSNVRHARAIVAVLSN